MEARWKWLAACVAACALLAILAVPRADAFSRSYANCAVLSQTNNITIYWTINGSYAYIAVAGPAPNGWLAAGFDTSGNMTGKPTGFAEIWIVRRNYLQDSVLRALPPSYAGSRLGEVAVVRWGPAGRDPRTPSFRYRLLRQ